MLDRAPRAADRLAVESRPSLKRHARRLERVRLAFEAGDCMVLIGRDDADGLHLLVREGSGGGGCGSMRWVLRKHGAIVMTSSNGERVHVSGVVSDEVTAVRVGEIQAHLENNGFMAEIGLDDSPVVFITTPAGEREVDPDRALTAEMRGRGTGFAVQDARRDRRPLIRRHMGHVRRMAGDADRRGGAVSHRDPRLEGASGGGLSTGGSTGSARRDAQVVGLSTVGAHDARRAQGAIGGRTGGEAADEGHSCTEKLLRGPQRLDQHAVGMRVLHDDVARAVGINERLKPSLDPDDGAIELLLVGCEPRQRHARGVDVRSASREEHDQPENHRDDTPRMGDGSVQHEVLTLWRASDHAAPLSGIGRPSGDRGRLLLAEPTYRSSRTTCRTQRPVACERPTRHAGPGSDHPGGPRALRTDQRGRAVLRGVG